MAFKSQKQADYFQWALERGKITQEQYDKKAKGTPSKLPEKVQSKRQSTAPRKAKVI